MEGGYGENPSPPPPQPPPSAAGYFSEVRIEGSSAAVGFSDPCPCCGNRKRRSLKPPDGSRKKLLVFDCPPTSPPPLLPTSALCRSESSPIPTASPSLTPSSAGSRSIGRSSSFPAPRPLFPSLSDSVAEIVPSPKPCSDPIPPMSPPRFLKIDRRFDRSSSSPSNQSPAHDKAASCLSDKLKKEAAAEEEGGVAEREEIRLSVSCRCGAVREVVVHHQ